MLHSHQNTTNHQCLFFLKATKYELLIHGKRMARLLFVSLTFFDCCVPSSVVRHNVCDACVYADNALTVRGPPLPKQERHSRDGISNRHGCLFLQMASSPCPCKKLTEDQGSSRSCRHLVWCSCRLVMVNCRRMLLNLRWVMLNCR